MEIVKLEVVDSTQNYAKDKLNKGKKEFAVCAKTQTNGRGRIGNEWQSLEGGLWFSFVKDVSNFDKEVLSFFTLILGVSVFEVCSDYYSIELKLKWPNDLLLNNKKVCGILCEKVDNSIVAGVGINTNIDNKALIECGTSFFKETEKNINNFELMNDIIAKFNKNLSIFNKDKMLETYRENMAYINEKKFVKSINKEVIIVGIDDDGSLIIKENEIQSKITYGEIG